MKPWKPILPTFEVNFSANTKTFETALIRGLGEIDCLKKKVADLFNAIVEKSSNQMLNIGDR
jgi:hypothetical protein